MGRRTSNGKCIFCNAVFGKGAITKHLQSCKQRQIYLENVSKSKKSKQGMLFHILVEGRGMPMYWMHLEMPGSATLEKLDEFLRDVWLECCGHLSVFHIDGVTFASSPDMEYADNRMAIAIDKVLAPEMKFYHEYDFGSTTELTLKVLSVREGLYTGSSVQILARNEAPEFACVVCGKPATDICTECSWENGGWLCEKCASGHECGEEMLLPVVNSPRTGVCGYAG